MIYIAAMNARQTKVTHFLTAMTPAISALPRNDEEAEGHFLHLARQRWPAEAGWFDHAVSVYAVPTDTGYSWEPVNIDPMSPDPAALAAHEPTSSIEDSRGSAGLGGGDPLQLSDDERFNIKYSTHV